MCSRTDLKREFVETRPWPTRAGLQRVLFEYIEVWYNKRRLQSNLGRLRHAVYEALNCNADCQVA